MIVVVVVVVLIITTLALLPLLVLNEGCVCVSNHLFSLGLSKLLTDGQFHDLFIFFLMMMTMMMNKVLFFELFFIFLN